MIKIQGGLMEEMINLQSWTSMRGIIDKKTLKYIPYPINFAS